MTSSWFSELFKNKKVGCLTVAQLVDWRQSNEGSRLLLPPIQRSLVWSNEQIINYWDSLFRGYPAGTMLVHQVKHSTTEYLQKGRDAEGITQNTNEGDFQLFDGQQRMATILLGLGHGELTSARRLWVDIGQRPLASSGHLFQLRITSTGQPFGYDPSNPNRKLELKKRQSKWDHWLHENTVSVGNARWEAFAAVKGEDIIDSKCAISMAEIYNKFSSNTRAESTVEELMDKKGAIEDVVRQLITLIERASKSEIILQNIDTEIVTNHSDYIRLFTRLGQGGTRLSDDELTYSIIKQSYPKIHDEMKKIMAVCGRMAGEVDLVLASLRVAKVQTPWSGAKVWELTSRPTPDFVSKLKERKDVEKTFLEMIMPENGMPKLQVALTALRSKLAYDKKTHPDGLPNMLLARLPRELVDVLILFLIKYSVGDDDLNKIGIFRAYVLHWLLFVKDKSKAASRVFQHATQENWEFNQETITKLIEECEAEGEAHCLLSQRALSKLRNDVMNGDHILRSWGDRFASLDGNDTLKPGDSVRALSTNEEILKRALIWLQREYIYDQWPNYDPTSDRDEDLPIDLDHIIPSATFNFNWASRNVYLDKDTALSSTDFRWRRSYIGNSIGNYRWLSASDNRRRGKNAYEPLPCNGDVVSNPVEWEAFTITDPKADRPWARADVALFQRLIDLRTLELYQALVFDSGIADIVTTYPIDTTPNLIM